MGMLSDTSIVAKTEPGVKHLTPVQQAPYANY